MEKVLRRLEDPAFAGKICSQISRRDGGGEGKALVDRDCCCVRAITTDQVTVKVCYNKTLLCNKVAPNVRALIGRCSQKVDDGPMRIGGRILLPEKEKKQRVQIFITQ